MPGITKKEKQKRQDLLSQGLKHCPGCDQIKSLDDFGIKNILKNIFQFYCKECSKEYNAKRYIKNKSIINQKEKAYRLKYPEKVILKHIKNRCYNKNCKDYPRYGGRGIKNELTLEDIRFLMERDNYWEMKNPTIDRIDNDGNYTLSNCRFIENIENVKKRNIDNPQGKPILQYDKNGNFIKEWESLTESSMILGLSASHISAVCKNKKSHYTCGGFKWEYKYKEN